MRKHFGKLPLAALLACTGLAVSTTALAIDTPETEDNNNKAAANLVAAMAPGDTISGTTTGTSTTVAGVGSADYFNVTTTAAGAPGFYRYRLVLTTSGTAGHVGAIQGLTQTAGVPNAGTDTALQTSLATTTPARAVQWYANEGASQIYYRVTGVAATTAPYSATLVRDPVTPISAGSLAPGNIVITTVGQTTTDTDMWLYDANRNAITDGGNDDESIAGGGTGATLQSRLSRSLGAGTYYLAIANFNTANNLGSPADDDFRTGAVTDFPNAIVNTSSTATALDLDLTISNGASTIPVTVSRLEAFGVMFVQFTLTGVAGPAMTNCTATPTPVVQGNSTLLSTTVTPGGSPTITSVVADLSAFGGSASTPMIDGGGGVYSVNLNVPGGQTPGAYNILVTSTDGNANQGFCSIPLTVILPPPTNDTCGTATTVSTGTTFGDNAQATTDTTVTCTTSNKDLWYDFTAPVGGGTFAFDTEGTTGQGDTVLALFDACGGTQLACDDDGGTGLLSRIEFTLGPSQNVKVRVASFGGAPVGGGFNLNINAILSGACCNNTSGLCTVTSSVGCLAGSTYQGDNTVCTPTVCGTTGACCSSTGVCTQVLAAGCTGTSVFQGDGTVCSPSPCPPSGSCCIGTCCTVTLEANCTGIWTSGGVCTVNPCGSPANDDCSAAIAMTLGVQVSGDTCNATLDGIEPAPTCQTLHGKSVWYSFTAPATAAYTFTACGSAFDTIISVFEGGCGALTQLTGGCDDDSCDGITPPGSGLASVIASLNLNGGTTYLVRMSSFGTAPAGGQFVMTVNNLDALGGCCLAGNCTQTDVANCTGTFNVGQACTPSLCGGATGACCQGSNCVTGSAATCVGTNQLYAGDGTVCNVAGNYTTACCKADFNHVGGITVQDIFDFLNAYFNSDPFADINGGGTSVQDIFDFLNAYFAGGC